MTHVGYAALTAQLKVGEELDGSAILVSTNATEALLNDGLWPGGTPSLLHQLSTEDGVTSVDGRARADRWTVSSLLRVNDPLEELSELFVDFESEMFDEQLAWREALKRSGDDPNAVEDALRTMMRARGLNFWKLERVGSKARLRQTPSDGRAMYTWSTHATAQAWNAWESEADEDPVYLDALKAGWRLWYRRELWNSDEAFAEGMDDVAPEVWDAWTGLLVYYASEQGWIELPSESFTTGLREAYAHGLALVKPTEQGVLQWAMN